MSKSRQSRRDILKAAVALPLVYATPLRAAPPPAETVTPALIAAGHLGGGMAKLLLHISLVDLGRGGQTSTQRMA